MINQNKDYSKILLDPKAVEDQISKALSAVLDKIDAAGITKMVETSLNANYKAVAFKILGIRVDNWGKLEIEDNKNPFSKILMDKASESATIIMDKITSELDSVVLTSDFIKDIQKSYKEAVHRKLRSFVEERSTTEAKRIVETKLDELLHRYREPEAAAVNAIKQAIKSTEDPATIQLLERSLLDLERLAMERLDRPQVINEN